MSFPVPEPAALDLTGLVTALGLGLLQASSCVAKAVLAWVSGGTNDGWRVGANLMLATTLAYLF